VGEYIPTTSTINSAPRFDHNPTTGESLGLMGEEQRTNLLVQSNQFDTTWGNGNSSETAASGTAPDGTNTAWELKDTNDVAATAHILLTPSIPFTSGTSYSVSMFAKAGTLGGIAFVLQSTAFTSNLNIRFDLQTGTVASADAGSSGSIVAFPNGWYRCTATAAATATTSSTIQIRTATTSASFYRGDGTGNILIYGAQVEAGAFPTSYIPTTTATVTRSADVCSISGSNFDGWGNSTTGTYYLEAAVTRSNTPVVKVFLGTSTSPAESYYLYQVQNQGDLRTFDSTSVLDTVNTISDGVAFKGAVAYSSAALTRSLTLDGNLVAEGAFDGIYGSDLSIGSRIAGGATMTGTIKRLCFWPPRLPNSTLQGITQ